MSLQQTTLVSNTQRPRADFERADFDSLIFQKGRRVLVEKALKCPCKSQATSQQSNCKNCGGNGWVFINPRETRMVLSGFDAATKQAGWSEELRGMVNVTCVPEEELAFMDRITALDSEAIYSEVLNFKKYGTTLFAYTAYNVKKILNIALFEGTGVKLKPLVLTTDYTFERNAIILNSSYAPTNVFDLSVTIRYKYAPQFLVLEHKRESIQSFKDVNGDEKNQNLPIHAYARRSHYILNAQNLAADKILNNNYVINDCNEQETCSTAVSYLSTQTINIPQSQGTQGIAPIQFTNQSEVTVTHNLGRIVDVTVVDSANFTIEASIHHPNSNAVVISFNTPMSGTILIQ